MKPVFLYALALMVAPCAAQADTLWQIWQQARAHDPAFLAADAQLRMIQAQRPAALAALLPHLTAEVDAGPQKDSTIAENFYGQGFEPIRETEKMGVSTWQVSLTQTLFNWTDFKTYQEAGYAVREAALNYQASLEKLNVTVAQDYVSVLAATADVNALQQAAQGFATQYHDAEARYRAGITGIIAANEALTAERAIDAQLLQAQQNLIAAQQTLVALTGNPTLAVSGSLPSTLAFAKPVSLATWLHAAQIGNPTLAANDLNVAAEQARLGAAKGGYLPSVSLQLQHMQENQGGSVGYSYFGQQALSGPANQIYGGNQVTVELKWNIFDGGATHAAIDQAQAQRDQAIADAATARLAIWRDIRTDYAAITLDQATIQADREATIAAEQAVHAAKAGVSAGLVSENNLINDRQQLLSAQLDLHEAILDTVNHELALATAAGTATPQLIYNLSVLLTTEKSNGDHP